MIVQGILEYALDSVTTVVLQGTWNYLEWFLVT